MKRGGLYVGLLGFLIVAVIIFVIADKNGSFGPPPEVLTGEVVLTNGHNEECLDMTDQKAVSGNLVIGWKCDLTAPGTATWAIEDGRVVHRASKGNDLCLNIPKDSRVNGGLLDVKDCDGGASQMFKYENDMIKTSDGAFCVNLRKEDRRSVQLWNCPGKNTTDVALVWNQRNSLFAMVA